MPDAEVRQRALAKDLEGVLMAVLKRNSLTGLFGW